MYCAWLRTGNKWRITYNASDVAKHEEDVIIVERREDTNDALLEMQARDPDKHTIEINHNEYMVTDHPCFKVIDDEAMYKLEECGAICVLRVPFFVSHNHGDRSYHIAGINAKRRDGAIAEKIDNDHWLVTMDHKLWEIANKKVDKLRAKRAKKAEDAKVTHPEVKAMLQSLARRCGFQFGNPDLHEITVAILANDFYNRTDDTDSQLKPLAEKWLKFNDENSKRFLEANWLTEQELTFLIDRFKKITGVSNEETLTEENPS